MSADKEETKVDAAEKTEEKTDAMDTTEAKEVAAEEKKPALKPKEPEKPTEKEEDAADDSRPRVDAKAVEISSTESTINVLPVAGGNILMTYSDGGFQYLLAGAKCTAGIKSGRYMFEVQMLEQHNKGPDGGRAQQVPKHVVRIGLAKAGASLLVGDGDAGTLCFDNEGTFIHERQRKKAAKMAIQKWQSMALLVNLEEGSENANTVSLFKDGVRISDPQPIPESMRGEALFPAVTYKNVSLQVNFGPVPLKALPFKCRMVGDAAEEDIELVKSVPVENPELVVPVGVPETGFFDVVDSFIAKNPSFVELSDRKIVEWAVKSGLWTPKNSTSLDKPEMKWGIPGMDDSSVRMLLQRVAHTTKRNVLVAELKGNLMQKDRASVLERFAVSGYKKKAVVFVGSPNGEYKEHVKKVLLADKQKKHAEEQRKRKAEAARKKAIEDRKAGIKPGEAAEAKEAEPQEDEAMDEPVELTEEEQNIVHRKLTTPDVADAIVAKSYADFSLPTVGEGFDAVEFQWAQEAEATDALKKWIFEKKLTQRVDNIQVGEDFKKAWAEWQTTVKKWRVQWTEFKDPVKRKALIAKKEEEKKKARELKKKEAKELGEELEEEAEEPKKIDFEEVDVFGVEDVTDVGNAQPLFAEFAFEDWALLSARFEMHLLTQSFKKDLNDEDRQSFHTKDFTFYFNRYFKKQFNVKSFSCDTIQAFADLIKDTVSIKESGFVEGKLPEDTGIATFVKLTEEHRRERVRRLDAGDESAELKFPRTAAVPPQQQGAGGARPQQQYVRPGFTPQGGIKRPLVPSHVQPMGAAGGVRPQMYGQPQMKYPRPGNYGQAPFRR